MKRSDTLTVLGLPWGVQGLGQRPTQVEDPVPRDVQIGGSVQSQCSTLMSHQGFIKAKSLTL